MTASNDDRDAEPSDLSAQEQEDRNAIDACLARAIAPSKANWSAWATLAWIASSGDEKFVHAVQIYEIEQDLERGDDIAAGKAWWALSDASERLFGRTLAGALDRLEEAAQSELAGGMAFSLDSRTFVEVPRPEWNGWKRVFDQQHGLTLLPGYRNFKWASAAVRTAFPAIGADPSEEAERQGSNHLGHASSVKDKIGRPHGTYQYASDAQVAEEIVAELDAGQFEGAGRLTRAIKSRITDIEPNHLSDEAKVKRLRMRILGARPDLAS